MENLIQLMDDATGRWSKKIDDFDYVNLKFTAEMDLDSTELESAQEIKLRDIEIPEKWGSKLKWLKCFVCTEMASDELAEVIKKTPLEERKEKLLKLILEALSKIPGVGQVADILLPIIVWLIKRILKKAIDGWCEPCLSN